MADQSPAAKVAAPPKEEALEVHYLVPEFGEEQVALAWLRKNDPAAIDEERVTTVLNIHTVHKGMILHALVRKGQRRKPIGQLQPLKASPVDGQMSVEHTEPEEFIDEVVLGTGVKAADYWDIGASKYNSKLRMNDFFNALAAQATPWRVCWSDAASTRGGELPKFVVIRNC